MNILYNLAKWLFLYSVYFSSLFSFFSHFQFFFLLAHRLLFCFFLLFSAFFFFFLLSYIYMYFFLIYRLTRMIGVPLVAKQGSFVYCFWLCSSFSFPSVHT